MCSDRSDPASDLELPQVWTGERARKRNRERGRGIEKERERKREKVKRTRDSRTDWLWEREKQYLTKGQLPPWTKLDCANVHSQLGFVWSFP